MERAFLAAIARNRPLFALADRVRELQLPGGCLAGGCLFQTVWNALHGFEAEFGIDDYDVFYFDAADLSAKGEAETTSRVREACADLPLTLDVRNQARVHTWYPAEYGAPSPPFRDTQDGIDHFLGVCCSYGLRVGTDEAPVVYAPWGYDELFDLAVRPNPRRLNDGGSLPDAYACKTERWRRLWPQLTILPWG